MRRPRKLFNQINAVPYIDVMLVLLIIFMATAPMINPGEIELPSVGQQLTAPVSPLEVTLKLDQSIWLRDGQRGGSPQKISREQLINELKNRQTQNPNQPVVIAADKAVRYEEVIKILDLLQRNAVKKVGLLARPNS